jgi:hypothetical protein
LSEQLFRQRLVGPTACLSNNCWTRTLSTASLPRPGTRAHEPFGFPISASVSVRGALPRFQCYRRGEITCYLFLPPRMATQTEAARPAEYLRLLPSSSLESQTRTSISSPLLRGLRIVSVVHAIFSPLHTLPRTP